MKKVLIAAVASALATVAVVAATGVAGSGDTNEEDLAAAHDVPGVQGHAEAA